MIYGVGLGPGDPDLMSVKARRLIERAQFVAYFHKRGRIGHARSIVEGLLPDDCEEYAMEYPVTTEIPISDPMYNGSLAPFYDDCAMRLAARAARGDDVLILCEGDPFFYGSFMHLYERLKTHHDVQTIPAITGMSGAYTATGQPITWGDDIMTVLMGTLDQETLTAQMAHSDALVIMKIGRNLAKVNAALKEAGKYDTAWIVEYATQPAQTVQKLADYGDTAPYFSIILVHGQGRRP